MKRLFLITICVSFSLLSKAQLSEGGTPLSFSQPQLKTTQSINHLDLKSIDIENEIEHDKQMGIENRYGIVKKVDIDIKKAGTKTEVAEGTIWRYLVSSDNAFSLGLFFSEYYLTEGSKLYIYNNDRTIIYGAFTSKNNKEYGSLAIAEFPEKELVLEYFEPTTVGVESKLILGKIIQSYKPIDAFQVLSETNDQVDINCPEGDLYQLEKHAVARMSFSDDAGSYICTGALINNVRNDGTPFFLTANHCISNSVMAESLVTYYNYERKTCGGTTTSPITLSGSVLKATYASSDVTLLELSEVPPPSAKAYFAGWNVEADTTLSSAFGIHHPAGEPKKIAIDYNPVISYSERIEWEGNVTTPVNSHWWVQYDVGFTLGGSSGSPLFDELGRIVGQLHGGSDNNDFYGKLSYSWFKPSLTSQKIAKHLDPDNTGTLKLNGYSPSDNDVEAHFYVDFPNVCENVPITFSNGSLFGANSFVWTIEPNTVVYHEGTSDTSRTPIVSFAADTSYTISLKATNSLFSVNTKTRSDYIQTKGLEISITSSFSGGLCPNEISNGNFLRASGAETYTWKILNDSENILIDSVSDNGEFIFFSKNELIDFTRPDTIRFQATGYHGNCSDSSVFPMHITYHINDNIENAIPIQVGNNGKFSNVCATTQTNEPNPAGGDCNNQSEWCECEVSEIILDNSLWFIYEATKNGILSIDIKGFDNQIAMYTANSYEDIISGNINQYSLVAANDDYYDESKNYAARIESAPVQAGKNYWVQVDGSACGATGEFVLIVEFEQTNSENTTLSSENNGQIKLFPNPAQTSITLEIHENIPHGKLEIYSIDGRIVKQANISNLLHSESLTFDISDLKPGSYLLEVSSESKTYTLIFNVIR